MLSNTKPPKQKKQVRGAWRDPSALDIVKRNALEQLQSTTEIFQARWGFETLRGVDEDLYEALADQRDMLTEACGPTGHLTECIEHRDAMRRGWAAANQVMEEALIGKVVEIFPGAKAISVRHKEDNPFALTDEPPLPLDALDIVPEAGDDPLDAA